LPAEPCERFQSWFKELNPASMTLIFPSAYMNNPSSMFGHLLLRVDQKGQTEQTRLLAYTTENGEDKTIIRRDVCRIVDGNVIGICYCTIVQPLPADTKAKPTTPASFSRRTAKPIPKPSSRRPSRDFSLPNRSDARVSRRAARSSPAIIGSSAGPDRRSRRAAAVHAGKKHPRRGFMDLWLNMSHWFDHYGVY
jgi:hypothetical protein